MKTCNSLLASACLLLTGFVLMTPAVSRAAGPKYTYLSAGYEWTAQKFAVEPPNNIKGFDIEGSIGLLPFLHVIGEYFDGDVSNSSDNFSGYKFGAGINYGITKTVDVVVRGAYVSASLDNLDGTGYSVSGLVRAMISDKTEVNGGYEYTDLGSIANRNVRVGLVYNVNRMFALQAGGTVFDNDSGFDLGFRVYFGDKPVSALLR